MIGVSSQSEASSVVAKVSLLRRHKHTQSSSHILTHSSLFSYRVLQRTQSISSVHFISEFKRKIFFAIHCREVENNSNDQAKGCFGSIDKDCLLISFWFTSPLSVSTHIYNFSFLDYIYISKDIFRRSFSLSFSPANTCKLTQLVCEDRIVFGVCHLSSLSSRSPRGGDQKRAELFTQFSQNQNCKFFGTNL